MPKKKLSTKLEKSAPKFSVTILDGDKLKKADELDKIDAMGQESERGAVKYIQAEGEERKKEDENKQDEFVEKLKQADRWSIKSYNQKLVDIMSQIIRERLDVPKGWFWDCWSSRKGVVISLQSPQGDKFNRGFTPCHDKPIDLNAAATLVEWAQDGMDQWSDFQEKAKLDATIKNDKVIKLNGE
jgi:hypothetical protein